MELEGLERLTKDLKAAAKLMSPAQARFFVDAYYSIQENRKREANQLRALAEAEPNEPHELIEWLCRYSATMEAQVKRALDAYSAAHPVGQWARDIHGIGPVIAAGLLAHIDIKQAQTAGHIWRFAGLDSTNVWLGKEGAAEVVREHWVKSKSPEANLRAIADILGRRPDSLIALARGRDEKKVTRESATAALAKRPWNAGLKTLCWKIGESFVKVSGDPEAFYAQLYVSRKELETRNNEKGQYAEQAKAKLDQFRIGKGTEAYKHYSVGKLPPGHIHARAKRYAVKHFLADMQHVWYEHEYGEPPPKPFVIEKLGHVHMREIPNHVCKKKPAKKRIQAKQK